ncbi:MAG: putative peptidoglycan glycosyltransferase FtsW [bacterium]
MRPSSLPGERRSPSIISSNGLPRRHKPDYVLLIIAILLLAIGLIVIYSIGPGLSVNSRVSSNYYINRQMISVLMGIIGFLVAAFLPLRQWRVIEKPLIIGAGIAAIAVRLFGQEVNGAWRWIQIGGLSFQADELIKFALLIWLAGFLADRIKTNQVTDFKKTLLPLIIVLAVVGFVVAGIESDFGTMSVIMAMMAGMAVVASLPLKRILIFFGVVVISVILAVATSSYRQQRILTYLHPSSDCQTTGYQTCQALIAVGSGGIIGLGLGNSVQAYGYLPEAANDSIFAIYAEKFGFIGTTILIGLFAILFSRIKNIIERAPNNFSRLLATGILVWFGVQSFINIGAMIGLIPLKGITLPFISYGGTSIMFVTAAVGIVFHISRYTNYTVPSNVTERDYYDNSHNGRRLGGSRNPTTSRR